jgi:hypothetical protein
MAQDSFPWGCNPATGDAGAVTVNDLVNAQQFGSNPNPNQDGVVYWTSTNPLPGGAVAVNGLLAASLAGSTVNIATGIGMVQGWNFVNDATVAFDFAADPGNASATDLIVLERGDPATNLTVRLARVKGAASTLATVTQSEALWQVAIAQVPLSAGGLPTSVVDVRRFVGQVMSYRRGGSATDWTVQGTTDYMVGNVKMVAGVRRLTVLAGNASATAAFELPLAFVNYPMVFTSIGFDAFSFEAYVTYYFTPVGTGQLNLVLTLINGAVGANTNYDVNWLAVGLLA